MKQLPGELIVYLASVLAIPELKAFRLCCRQFAALGQASLFQSFEFRLWPSLDRLSAFEQLVQTPNIASKLRTLSLTTGVLLEYADYRYWQAQVYKNLSSAWLQSLSGRTPSKDEYNAFHTALQARFTEETRAKYDLYRWYLDVEADLFAEQLPSRLSSAIKHLSQHTSQITHKLTMAEPEITLEVVEKFRAPDRLLRRLPEIKDPRRRVINRREATLGHLSGFLSAISQSGPLSVLTMHHLPLQLLESSALRTSSALDKSFTTPRQLQISISSLPHSDWLSRAGLAPAPYTNGRNPAARRLRQLLNNTAKLETLCLELLPGKEAELSFELFDRTNLDRFPRHFLKNLRLLSLSHFSCRWTDLRTFLQEAAKLEELTLANARLETGSMVDLILFTPSLELQSIQILGRWVVDEDGGEWHAHTPADFTDCVNATVWEGPYVQDGMRSIIQHQMLKGSDKCPLLDEAAWESSGDTSWHYVPR
jgi:hypothetical protein